MVAMVPQFEDFLYWCEMDSYDARLLVLVYVMVAHIWMNVFLAKCDNLELVLAWGMWNTIERLVFDT